MSVSFSGLISGLDTSSLISSLATAAKAPETQLQQDQSDLSSQKQIVSDLETRLGSLSDAVSAFDLASESQAMTATTSDSTHLSIAVSGGASVAAHDLRVLDTAQAQVVSSRTFASQGAGVLGAGNLTIQRAGQPDVPITWTSSDSLATIASRITQAGAGVSASVLYDGTSYRLLVGATATGTAAAPTFVDGGDGLGLADPSNVTVAARDAKLSIDGVTVTRGNNVMDDVLPGATITLLSKQAATDPDTLVSVAIDQSASAAKVQKVVTAFNSISFAITQQLQYTGTAKGSNTLFGDSTLQGLQRTLGNLVTGTQFGSALDSLGVSIDRGGQLSLDTDKLTKALTADPTAVAKVFGTTGGGLRQAMSDLVDSYTRAGDGILVAKSAGMDARIKLYQTQIDQIDTNADALTARLTAQFNALESTLSQLKNSSSFLTASSSSSTVKTSG